MKAIFGTMNLGQQVFGEDAVEMLRAYLDAGGSELDTAYVYNDGACEILLGDCLSRLGCSALSIATKANPRVTGRLDRKSVVDQLEESLERMRVDHVDVLFLHFPDKGTPIRSALEGCADLCSRGLFRELGVSNFPLSLVEEMLPVCDEVGCPRPTVFEGVYNTLSRKAELELLPALDRLGMRFHAYNPLAGGMLTGKHTSISDDPAEGRFVLRAKSYRGRYWKESYFEAVGIIGQACSSERIHMAEASLRWLAHHSMLSVSRGDGIIVGASNIGQLRQNLEALEAGPLPVSVVSAMDRAWETTAADAPEYYRFYENGKAV